jgi:hypothetical protein
MVKVMDKLLACLFLLPFAGVSGMAAAPAPAAVTAYNAYIQKVEMRLAGQHRAASAFLGVTGNGEQSYARMKKGEQVIEQLTPATGDEWDGAMLHHWRGSAFAPGAKAADFERLMRDFAGYPKVFSPQVVSATVLTHASEDEFQVRMRVKQKHVLTVVMDTDYDTSFGKLDGERGYSLSRSTRIAEIEAAGTAKEKALSPEEAHGFLWRMNSYWSYEERDGGLYMQIETVSMTRSIPRGLGWAVGPFVQSVPRESLEFTLSAVCGRLKK